MKHGTLRIFGRAGWRDWNVARYASDRDLILVTNNASDFRATLDELAAIGEPVNRVLEVDLDCDEVTLAVYDWPSTENKGG
jgi:hypothetical protein